MLLKGCTVVGNLLPHAISARSDAASASRLDSIPSFGNVFSAALVPAKRSEPGATPRRTSEGSSLYQWYSSPDDDLEQIDLEFLERSGKRLDVAMYAFTDERLAVELVDLSSTGTRVRLYRDREQYEQELREHSRALSILTAAPNIEIRVKADSELMHVKARSDGRLLRSGSANWSVSGERRQDNNMLVTTDRAAVASFEEQFNEMWARATNVRVH